MSFATARKRGLMFKQKIVWPRPNLSARESLCLTLLLLLSCSPQFAHGTRAQASSYRPTPVQSTGQQPTRPNIAAQSKAVTALVPDRPVEREISGGQTQTYQITLASGQYALLTVQQNGIDVVAKLFAPDDKLIGEVDNDSRAHGQEILEVVALTSGAYRIEIAPRYKSMPPGRYEIRVAQVRAATERDASLDEARRLHAQARREYLAGKYTEAIQTEQKSLGIRQKILGPDHTDVASS